MTSVYEKLIMTEKEIKMQRQKDMDIMEFYLLAAQYGFCTPYCNCEKCKDKDKE